MDDDPQFFYVRFGQYDIKVARWVPPVIFFGLILFFAFWQTCQMLKKVMGF
jgi:hypothetical protein